MPASVHNDPPDSYGGVPAVGASMQAPEALVRRPSSFTYVFGGFFALVGIMFLTIGSRLLAFGVAVPPLAEVDEI
ncbi:hypothetical protein [Actinomyces qiguomingii]|uniref:hypothetical protein n=1 Tax=Actinomyces qiguomingii TaxID=2057800 RepID=UPI000CA045A2|nr:hypothetical protein [Actinomyces qiguomingii]